MCLEILAIQLPKTENDSGKNYPSQTSMENEVKVKKSALAEPIRTLNKLN
jgi:hypothetical protein